MGMTEVEKRALKRGGSLPDLSELPVRVPRDAAAKLVSRFYFQVSPRTMERWPLPWRRVNGRAHCETADIFAHAESLLAEAPPVRASQRSEHERKI